MPPKEKKIRSRAWFFTYNNYSTENLTQLHSKIKSLEVDYVFQEELGLEGTPHIQGCMRFKNPVYISFQKNFTNKIHWERCRSWPKSIQYCTKRETRINNTVYSNIKGLKIRQRIENPIEGKELYDWQSEVLDIIKTKPDRRTVYWYWEPIGNTGKSSFCFHLIKEHEACVLGATSRDSFYAFGERIEEKDCNVVVFDLDKVKGNRVNYTVLESLKKGFLFVGKYESGQKLFNPPHVFVFANFAPDTDKLSADRWVINRINLNKPGLPEPSP